MGYRRNLTNSQIVPLALMGGQGETTTGNMSVSDRTGRRYMGDTGQMPRPWARLIDERAQAGAVSMVIYSYSTPIAWRDADYGWVIPNVTYSVTTSAKHQNQLWRLRGTTYYMPWDATAEDARRVLSGELAFVRDSKGRAVATVPGPNYISGIVAVGERIRFRDLDGAVRVGVIKAKGTIAGWAVVDGEDVRFEDRNIIHPAA
ncbi:hypothetical protein SEA_PIONEER3_4 [Microbacterium phage Pioneer3]|nr:hypothetical protein SEA_PIONEER3_115 [Microbacterium phage Pioneer3]AWY05938.1 hypothetical protein SEA_PIONEER3_4 [Microbacterium phage Pioneer3]